jgi:hypothetical protein
VGTKNVGGITGRKDSPVYDGVTLSFPGTSLRPVRLSKQGVVAYPSPQADYVLLGRNALAGGDDKRAAMALSYDAGRGAFKLAPKPGGRRGRAEDMLIDDERRPKKSAAEMSAAEINKALDRLDVRQSKNTDRFIEAGRGHERPNEYLEKDDPLSREARDIWEQQSALRYEIERRYGPRAPSRLPRGFGPIRGGMAGYTTIDAMTDASALAVGLVAGHRLNKAYPEGVTLAGVNVPVSVPVGGLAIGAGVVARHFGWQRTGRALIVGGVGAGVAALSGTRGA